MMSVGHIIYGGRLVIDLDALVDNYTFLQKTVYPSRCSAVVKANGYGLGAIPICKALYANGCRDFFVSHLKEGMNIRPDLPLDAHIYVLNGLPPNAEKITLQHRLIPVLNTATQLRYWHEQSVKLAEKLPCALQFDSGMGRLGMTEDDVALVLDCWFDLDVRLTLSHLACADTPSNPYNYHQKRRFDLLLQKLPPTQQSLSASSGIFLGRDWHYDLVRPGLALYGGNPTPGEKNNPMRPVISVYGRIASVNTVPPGSAIGYGATFITSRPSLLVTLSIGYADGIFRLLGNRARAIIPGYEEHILQVIGRISMDSLVIDATDLSSVTLREGQDVQLIGPHYSIDQMAEDSNTVPHEVLTALGDRYERIYSSKRNMV